MGLRFQVPRDCGVLAVTASWGRYEGFGKENEDGRRILWSRRTPVEKSAEIDVRGHDQHVTLDPIELDDDVSLRVELFPLDDRVIVELALSNDRVTGMDAPPGTGCSRPSCGSRRTAARRSSCPPATSSIPATTRPTTSVGDSTCSTGTDSSSRSGAPARSPGTEAADGSRRATAVETTWLPTADVPQTIAGSAGAAVTSMRELAEIAPEDGRASVRAAGRRLHDVAGRAASHRRRAAGPPPGDRRRGDRRGRGGRRSASRRRRAACGSTSRRCARSGS